MSLGMRPGQVSTQIIDGINFAWNMDKMIVCAAGTSFVGVNDIFDVVFPANHPNTIAVTGIKEPTFYPNPLSSEDVACSDCHYGADVWFSVIMERSGSGNDDRTTLATSCDGDVPTYSSGTSCATATFAGMAALIWANQGVDTPRDIIISSLIQASSNNLNPHPYLGFGWVDINAALQLSLIHI